MEKIFINFNLIDANVWVKDIYLYELSILIGFFNIKDAQKIKVKLEESDENPKLKFLLQTFSICAQTTYLYTQWLRIGKIRSSKVCKVKLLNIIIELCKLTKKNYK
jgi:hypothetical protein